MGHGIPVPPTPPIALLAAVGAGCVVIGVLLAFHGRRVGRLVLAAFAAIAAAALAPLIARHGPFGNVWLVGAAGAVTAFLFALVLARLFWAITMGAVLGIAALGVVAHCAAGAVTTQPVWDDQPLETFSAWFAAFGDYLVRWLGALWGHSPHLVAPATAVPIIVCVGVEMLLARSVVIFASATLGTAAAVGGACLLAWAFRPDWAGACLARADLLAAVAGGVALLGMAVQARGELRGARPAEAPEDEQGEQDRDD